MQIIQRLHTVKFFRFEQIKVRFGKCYLLLYLGDIGSGASMTIRSQYQHMDAVNCQADQKNQKKKKN